MVRGGDERQLVLLCDYNHPSLPSLHVAGDNGLCYGHHQPSFFRKKTK